MQLPHSTSAIAAVFECTIDDLPRSSSAFHEEKSSACAIAHTRLLGRLGATEIRVSATKQASISHHVWKRHAECENAEDQLANEKRLAAAAHFIERGAPVFRGRFWTRLLIVHAGAPLQ
jgi:hypothetical protein